MARRADHRRTASRFSGGAIGSTAAIVAATSLLGHTGSALAAARDGISSKASGQQLAQQGKKGQGCWLNGKWFPEGAKVYPPQRSRIAAPGYSLCKNGKWQFITTIR